MPEAHILSRMLLLQSRMASVPEDDVPAFVAQGLAELPGVEAAALESAQAGPAGPGEAVFPLRAGGDALGQVRLRLADGAAFSPYAGYLEAFCAMLAALMGERRQRRRLEQQALELELRAERRTADLRESLERYRALFASVGDPVLVADLDTGALVECNSAAEAYFRRSRAELLGMVFCDLLPPGPLRDGKCGGNFIRRVANEGTVSEVELVTADGEQRFASVRTSAFVIGGRRLSLGVFRDVTGQKAMERQLERSREELDNFRLLLESMTENMIDMLWAKDTQGRYLFANPAIRRDLLCSDDEEVLGRTDTYFAQRQRALGQRHTFGELCVNTDEVVLGLRVPGRFEEDGLVRGQYLMLDVQKSPLYDREGRLIGTVGTGRDITDRKRAEEELRARSALLKAQAEASLDGILVVNERNQRVLHNRRVAELFDPPPAVFDGADDAPLLRHVTSLVSDPEGFLAKVEHLYANPELVSRDEIELRDGRVLDRFTAPVTGEDGAYHGRIWTFRDITSQRQAEQAIRLSEQRFRTLTQVAPVGIFQADARGRCTYVNEYWSTLSGFPGETALGLGWLSTLHPPHRRLALEGFRNCLRTGREFSAEFRFRAEGRPASWFLLRAAAEHSPQGEFVGFVGALIDITERKQAEEALRNSREQLREVMDLVPHFIFAKDSEGRFILANKALAAAYGTTVEDLLGRTDADFARSEAEVRLFRQVDLEAMHSGETQTVSDEPITDATGRTRRLSTIKVPFRFSGTDAPAVLGVAVDITEQKRAEEALLNESLRLSILMERSNDGIVIIDQEHRVVEANLRFAEMLGYTREEMVGLHTWDYEADMSEADIRQGFDRLERVNRVLETRHRRKDGSVFDVEVGLSGAMVGGQALIFAICRDITSRREHQATLFQAKEAAEGASRAKSLFLANMSHEIRTPLNGLLGMLQLIQTSDIGGEVAEYTAMALRAGRRLTTLLNDILDLSRIEAGRMPLSVKPFSPAALATALAETFLPAQQGGEVPLRVHLEPNVPRHVLGDETRVRQMLFNLVGNALKFTEEGRVDVHISRLPASGDGRARLLFCVSDTGIGIPLHKVDDICAPFTQVAEDFTRSHQGAGLGLAIVRQLARAMGGTLAFDSEQGQGTTAYLMLPFALPEEEARPEAGPEARRAGPALRVLLVEDDAISSLGTRVALERMGHATDVADNGVQALEALARKVYDCVLMDIQMHGMDGLEAMRRIRGGEAGVLDPRVPIIALTAYAMDGDREKLLAAGMDAYLAKPLQLPELEQTLARLAEACRPGARAATRPPGPEPEECGPAGTSASGR